MTQKRRPAGEPTEFGVRLKQAREAKGLSMRAHAKAAGVAHATLSLVEAGRQSTVDVATAVSLARVVGVSVEWLVTGAA